MTRLRVMTIVGTRPEIIRLSEVIKAFDRAFDHILVHTGQNYDHNLSKVFFEDLGLRDPDHFLDAAHGSLGENLGRIIERSFAVLSLERPDALLVLGDTNSALSVIPAKRLKIPIFHMEAGNRCYDPNVPEEINRRIVDHTADVNLTYTEHSRRNLLQEGLPSKYLFVTGSPMLEVLNANTNAIDDSAILSQLQLQPNEYFVVSAHREENIDGSSKFQSLCAALNAIARQYGLPLVFSTHPRTAHRIAQERPNLDPLIRNMDPLGFHDYVALQRNSRCVLSDSGTLSEESAMLGFPAVLLRDSTERPEAVDAGTIVVGNVDAASILQSIEVALAPSPRPARLPFEYGVGTVSNTVVRLVQSFTSMVNTMVWRKEPPTQ